MYTQTMTKITYKVQPISDRAMDLAWAYHRNCGVVIQIADLLEIAREIDRGFDGEEDVE